MTFVGVEQTTDRRSPETVVKFFGSRLAADRWAADSGGFAWPGAADADLPGTRQNWHHRLREVYEVREHLGTVRARARRRFTRFTPYDRGSVQFVDLLALEIRLSAKASAEAES